MDKIPSRNTETIDRMHWVTIISFKSEAKDVAFPCYRGNLLYIEDARRHAMGFGQPCDIAGQAFDQRRSHSTGINSVEAAALWKRRHCQIPRFILGERLFNQHWPPCQFYLSLVCARPHISLCVWPVGRLRLMRDQHLLHSFL